MTGVFKAYDIRGIYPQEIDEGIAYLIGRAVVVYTEAKKIIVGNDMRASSEPLKEALIRGIIDQGGHAIDIDLCSTPLFDYAVQKYPAGIMVTASHNPKQYNGFKICREKAISIGQGTGMEEIEQLVLSQQFPEAKAGKVTQKSFLSEYIRFCLKFLKTGQQFTVVVDTANGMGGHTYAELERQLPKHIKLVPLFWRLDGSFPNHEANPHKEETLRALQEKVIEVGADCGVATDGDGDRIGFVDERGNVVQGHYIMALLAESLLQGGFKRKKITYDLCASKVVSEAIEARGGIAVETRVGHAFVKKAMREEKAIFGAETSGHMYHAEMSYAESELIPLLRVLNVLGAKEKVLSAVIEPFRKYAISPEINYEVGSRKKIISILQKVEEKYKKEASKILKIDGLKMMFNDWWFCMRASNTEPLLRLVVEANDQKILKEKLAELEKFIK